jgi:uncharacterized protein (DUF2267 family)
MLRRMDFQRFIATVAARAHLSDADAERATQATLETLNERLTGGEARDLVRRFLPPELAAWMPRGHWGERFDADEFVRRVAKREDVDPDTAEQHARVVLRVVREAIGPEETARLAADLPEDFRPVLFDLIVMPADELVAKVAVQTGLGPDDARRAVRAVLETLAERVPPGEVRDVMSRLPREFHEDLRAGLSRADDDSRRMPATEFLRRVAEREGVSPELALRHVRALHATLREAVSPEEFADVQVELPNDYDPLLPRP